MDKNLEMFCVTDKHFNFFKDIKYKKKNEQTTFILLN